jgi:hypothetical protein
MFDPPSTIECGDTLPMSVANKMANATTGLPVRNISKTPFVKILTFWDFIKSVLKVLLSGIYLC